ncbi:HD-GYP domain-containing protein [Cytobacillus oceanisediminis]|uniref:HD-GYP domain-containing protein n=2 Tax=Niallia TaxID=2837506 RepID=A0A941GJK0_NIACI|nr:MULTISPECIES: HD-GYP domain-containing protein [Bacillaceae]MBQ6447752.1 HD-GYP domain-containing protein [Bacillus sp. (in: firmicutes)]MDU1846086.1 HD-GYP domain-containing protein [Niallia nealsonii]MBZ9536423.1 HD-GYP domain-containing protein [Cytobacillus oceanisediminis]MCB5235944.1 HD-GYP domain-containing protein [Niallia circulans]MED3794171.1 HD-GYP domain-containing protein [Niallia alba]
MGIINAGEFIETVYFKGLQISLMAAGDGTEVIYHKLQPGSSWAMTPEDNWDGFEYFYILSGKLSHRTDEDIVEMKAGQAFFESPIKKYSIFTAEEITEFIYITSQPVFHYYSQCSKDLMELAISIEEKDGYTVDHCERIKHYSMLVGEALDLNRKQITRLNLASFFHDVGKVRVPLEILQKPAKLTEDEWAIMKKHTTFGRDLLEETKIPVLCEVGLIVEQHHERYDGKGYPKGLKESEISIEAAIISVVDSFDAMTTDRVYKKGKAAEEAFQEILNNRGTMYHPLVVDTFIALKEKIINEKGEIL